MLLLQLMKLPAIIKSAEEYRYPDSPTVSSSMLSQYGKYYLYFSSVQHDTSILYLVGDLMETYIFKFLLSRIKRLLWIASAYEIVLNIARTFEPGLLKIEHDLKEHDLKLVMV